MTCSDIFSRTQLESYRGAETYWTEAELPSAEPRLQLVMSLLRLRRPSPTHTAAACASGTPPLPSASSATAGRYTDMTRTKESASSKGTAHCHLGCGSKYFRSSLGGGRLAQGLIHLPGIHPEPQQCPVHSPHRLATLGHPMLPDCLCHLWEELGIVPQQPLECLISLLAKLELTLTEHQLPALRVSSGLEDPSLRLVPHPR